MASSKIPALPSPVLAWVDKDGKPSVAFLQFISQFTAAMTGVASAQFGSLPSAANDAAAAKAGVVIGGLYQNSGAVRIRLV
jgi:hypothetical protein